MNEVWLALCIPTWTERLIHVKHTYMDRDRERVTWPFALYPGEGEQEMNQILLYTHRENHNAPPHETASSLYYLLDLFLINLCLGHKVLTCRLSRKLKGGQWPVTFVSGNRMQMFSGLPLPWETVNCIRKAIPLQCIFKDIHAFWSKLNYCVYVKSPLKYTTREFIVFVFAQC